MNHVLGSRDLLLVIASYQRGFDHETLVLRRLLRDVRLHDLIQLQQKNAPQYRSACAAAFGPFHDRLRPRSFVYDWGRLQLRYHIQYYGLVYGHLSIVQSMTPFDCKVLAYTQWIVAAFFGHVHVLAFLYEHDRACYDTRAMRVASSNGHLDVVRFLHERGFPTDRLMHLACVGGHLALAQYARDMKLDYGVGTATINFTASNGHVETLRFLHEHGYEGFSSCAMDAAARHGHVAVVRFLHEARPEGCSEKALLDAAQHGHVQVVRFLEAHYTALDVAGAARVAAYMGHMEVVEVLLKRRRREIELGDVEKAARQGKIAAFSDQRKRACQMIIEYAGGGHRAKKRSESADSCRIQ
ncbi:hypothetical protein SDRG_08677 [Saprolegnia diclina VS20]|uniref:Uncharacterized protein n=1 Tax=Saprolegnia diclina (strain VS20) TaxID=1156394 RepID=T0RNR1_SAPDV|nr:hypothetical protein SDRG_08677 [Saprolegnia diclina VS20]EQC33998.1 hypothetical protein SDRG_08677 [Saprolegnia diclina VS20]|eukprot:XP_008612793.1 hypothetical protein SDRG_08677 [Saprolegnia diclina VS20]